uniref:Uncharacterized protein LOC114349391 n=1 Tax=Diabrotica virgifera virgifera TaxID=50390 RepID=A0A6P7HD56_DIAVI
MLAKVLNLVFIVLAIVKYSEACNGYSLKMDHIKACADDSITVPQDMDMTLDKNCNIVVSGCVEVLKPIKTAKATYEVSKAPLPAMTGDVDLCQVAGGQLAQAQALLVAYGLPKKCPVAAKKYCVNGKKNINISAHKNQLGMAVGTITAKLNVEHDTGKSCVDIQATVSKKK